MLLLPAVALRAHKCRATGGLEVGQLCNKCCGPALLSAIALCQSTSGLEDLFEKSNRMSNDPAVTLVTGGFGMKVGVIRQGGIIRPSKNRQRKIL
jgi:hypothetical protein